MAKTDTVDEELVNGLKVAKTKRCYFALVMKGGADGALLITKQKVPPVLITLAKKRSGGSAVVKGAVFYEDGKYVFETAKVPAATMPNVLKLLAKRDAGLHIAPICRMGINPDLAEDGAGASPQSAAPQPGATQSVQPATKPNTGDAQVPNAAAYAARVAALTENLKKAILSKTEAGNDAKLQFSQSQMLAKKSNYVAASKLLDLVENRIEEALAGSSQTDGASSTAKVDGDNSNAKLAATYQQRVAAISPDLKQALGSNTPAGNEAKLKFKEAQLHAGKQQFALALDLLKLTEDQINLALGKAGASGTSSAGGVSAAAFRAFQERWKPIREEWQTASETVDQQIGDLQETLLKSDDKQLQLIAKFGLNALTGDFKVPMMAAMHELLGATPANLKMLAAKLQATAAAFQSHLASESKKVKVCDANPFGVKVTIGNLLIPALAEVQATLATVR
jgi:hypothetical protein